MSRTAIEAVVKGLEILLSGIDRAEELTDFIQNPFEYVNQASLRKAIGKLKDAKSSELKSYLDELDAAIRLAPEFNTASETLTFAQQLRSVLDQVLNPETADQVLSSGRSQVIIQRRNGGVTVQASGSNNTIKIG